MKLLNYLRLIKPTLSNQLRRIHKSDDIINHTVNQFSVEKTPITAQLWQMRKSAMIPDKMPTNEVQVSNSKTTKSSRVALYYNFASDLSLRDLYIDHEGNVLIGKLFEDLDALAGNIAILHCENDIYNRKYTLVTASVDKIIKTKPISIRQNVLLVGQVAWVGRSSLDIIMEIHEIDKATDTNFDNVKVAEPSSGRLLTSIFTYVARDKITGKSAPINKLDLLTETEKKIFEERQNIANSRKNRPEHCHHPEDVLTKLIEAGTSMEDMPALAHPNAVLMKLTSLENSLLCQPQNVNTAGRVFGGFLVHRAYDLALATCYTFSGVYPEFRQVDEISFKKPVDVGDLVRLKSRVLYTSDTPMNPAVVVEVTCQVIRPERASSFISNTFNFVFGFNKSITLRKILPSSLEEANKLLDGVNALKKE